MKKLLLPNMVTKSVVSPREHHHRSPQLFFKKNPVFNTSLSVMPCRLIVVCRLMQQDLYTPHTQLLIDRYIQIDR